MMTEILICPQCGSENPLTADRCQVCDAVLDGISPVEDVPNENTPRGDAPDEVAEDEGTPKAPSAAQDDFDLLPGAENDLPSLLHALKHDGEVEEKPEEPQESPEEPDSDAEQENEEGEPHVPEEVPDWLHRIRQRASEEEDSVGEITQKIMAAKESVDGGDDESLGGNFVSWIQQLRGENPEEEEEKGEPLPDEPPQPGQAQETPEQDPDWLEKIRAQHRQEIGDEVEEDGLIAGQKGNSLLQWLVELEEQAERRAQADLESPEGLEVLGDETRQIDISGEGLPEVEPEPAGQADLGKVRYIPPTLTVSREEKIHADQLTATIVDERTARPMRQPESSASVRVIRLALAVLLLVGLSLVLLFGGRVGYPHTVNQPSNESLVPWAEELPEGAPLLLVFDYQPGFSEEISLAARPILNQVIDPGSEIFTISSAPSGQVLAQRLLGSLDVGEAAAMVDLGYFPAPAYAAYGLANLAQSGWTIPMLPDPVWVLPSGSYESILILSDSSDSAAAWVEQFSALSPDTPINLLVTAQAGPLLIPYWESGQVRGMVSGIAEGAKIERQLLDGTAAASYWQAYRAGILLLVAVLGIGAIFSTGKKPVSDRQGDR